MNPVKFTLVGVTCALAMASVGCTDDGDTGDQRFYLSGRAAIGAALANANITAIGANGVTVSVTSDATGAYSLPSNSLTPPVLIRASGGRYDSDGDGTLDTDYTGKVFSLSPTLNGTVNTTPLTTLTLQNVYNVANVGTVFTAWDTESDDFSLFALSQGISRVAANLSAQMTAAGLTSTTYNFFTQSFTANGNGIDGVLDGLSCTVTNNTPLVDVACTYNDAPLAFDFTGVNISGYTIGQNLDLYVKAGLLPGRTVTQTIPPPASEDLFCAGTDYLNQFASAAQAAAGSVTITSCSFSGNVGVMKGTLQVSGISVSGEARFTWH